MSIFYSPRLRAAIAVAESDAGRQNSEFIGTEHMLMALFDGRETVSREVLENLGITREKLVAEIDRVCKRA
jgi:ATP-dependent Clp protease ATP-binding subunit ClpA